MKILKYIINDKDIPIVFSNEIVHNEIFQKAKSAGLVCLTFDKKKKKFKAKCFGESTSLKINSKRDEDNMLIEMFLNENII